MPVDPRPTAGGIRDYLGWIILASPAAIFLVGWLLLQLIAVNRLTIHNATSSPIVFAGEAGEAGSRRQVDIFVDACESGDFEWALLGWSTERSTAFEPLQGARRVEISIAPPPDNVAGTRYTIAVTEDGIENIQPGEPVPTCSP